MGYSVTWIVEAAAKPFFKGLNLLPPNTKEFLINAALCYKSTSK